MKVSGPTPSHFSHRDVFYPAFCACWACFLVICAHGFCEAQTASPTQTTLSLSSSSVPVGTTVTLTADVTSSGVPVSPGLVLFCKADAPRCVDAAVFGQVQLTNHGVASIPLRLGIGTYNIKAVFQGVARTSPHSAVLRQPSSSTAQKLTVESPSKVASTTSLSVTGGSGSYQFTSTIITPARPISGGTLSLLDLAHSGASLGSLPLSVGTRSVNLFNSYAVPNPYVFNIMQIASGDFNRDGIPDLAVTYDSQAVTILLGKGDGSFTGGTTPQVSSGNQAVAVGDFNGDGIPDLAVGQFDNGSPCCSVSILPGVGDGRFGAPLNFQVNSNVSLLLAGDFDGDGILDLAVVDSASLSTTKTNSTITVEFGNGDGTFGRAMTITLDGKTATAGDDRDVPSVLIGDFNGDGALDIATLMSDSNTGQSAVELLLGVGDGSFTPRTIPVSEPYCVGLAAADFNGDGHQDLAVSSITHHTITTLLGDGTGGFTPLTPQKLNNFAGRLAAADFNNDGIPDLVLTGVLVTDPVTFETLGGLSFFFGVGDGTFVQSDSAIAAPLGENVGYTSVPTVADFNGDGVPDIAIDYFANSALGDVFLNQPEATVTLPASLPGGGSHSIEAIYSGDTVYKASSSAAVTVQNITATPLLFPASGDYPNPVQITITDPTPGAIIYYTINPYGDSSGIPGKSMLYTGPFLLDEGSALPDDAEVIATATAPGYLPSVGSAFEAYGVPAATQVRLGFAPYASNPAGIRVSLQAYVTANGVAFHDGIVVFCNATAAHCEDSAILGSRRLVPGGWAILRQRFGPGTYHIRAEFQGQPRNGRGPSSSPVETLISRGKVVTTTEPVQAVHTGTTYTLSSQVIAYGESPLDGTIVFKDSINGAAPVVLGSVPLVAANATVGLTAAPASNTGGAASTFAVADFDRDGISDMVTANTSENTLSILHGNPDATFTPKSTVAVAAPPTLVTTGDLNGDDLQDLVVTSRSMNTITILLGKLDGTFITGATLTTGAGPQGTVIADFNGDGFPDIATADTDAGMVSIFLGDGHGNFPTSFNLDVPGKPVSLTVADFNNDGLLDIATSNLDGTATVLLGGSNLLSLLFSTGSTLSPGGHGLIAEGDFNGDGIPDLAIPAADAIVIYIGKGDGTFTLKGSVAASDVQSIEVADFNGDNLSDLAVTRTTGTQSSVVLFLGAGDGTFPKSTAPKVTSFSASTVTGDFNGDSIPDLAALDLSNNTVGVLLGEQSIIGAIHGIVLSTPGTHAISATYSGSSTFAGSASQPVTITVSKPTSAPASLSGAHD
jgi:FG-GAP-like repeat/Bacterial Ig-like domain (group 3)